MPAKVVAALKVKLAELAPQLPKGVTLKPVYDRTELVLYRRSLMAVQPIAITPAGVPRQVSLSADGRVLAVEVSRGGLWQVDLLELP